MSPEEGVSGERDVATLAVVSTVHGRCGNRDGGIHQLLIAKSRCKTYVRAVYTSSDETGLYPCR